MAVEKKVWGGAYGALAAGFLAALLNAGVGDAQLMGGLPPWLQFIILTLVPGVVSWLGGYALPSPTSSVSKGSSR
jgi:hypothetical protein